VLLLIGNNLNNSSLIGGGIRFETSSEKDPFTLKCSNEKTAADALSKFIEAYYEYMER